MVELGDIVRIVFVDVFGWWVVEVVDEFSVIIILVLIDGVDLVVVWVWLFL